MRKAGFTLVEILVVIGIISVLLGILVACLNRSPGPPAGTKAQLLRLSMALQSYRNEFHAFPPDGYDEPVIASNGRQLKGSACLTYFLAWKYPDGSGGFVDYDMTRRKYINAELYHEAPANNGRPFWDCNVKKELTKSGEILDLFGNPVRYDNCERARDGIVRYSPGIQPMAGGSDPDPREATSSGRPFSTGRYDLWSCGPDGGARNATAADDIILGCETAR